MLEERERERERERGERERERETEIVVHSSMSFQIHFLSSLFFPPQPLSLFDLLDRLFLPKPPYMDFAHDVLRRAELWIVALANPDGKQR